MSKRGGGEQHGGGGGGHDGGGSMRWLLTYADMITLLMAFFIMMYSMSVMNLEKFREVAFSIRSGFGGPMQGGQSILNYQTHGESATPSISDPEQSGGAGALPGAAKEIEQYVKQHQLGKFVRVRAERRGLVVSLITDEVMFGRGRAELRPKARQVLAQVAGIARKLPNLIAIEGHTCDLPIRTAQFPSNWELSTARAATVVRFLIEQGGLPARRLSASGYADSRPLVANDSEAHRTLNRRVDIVIMDDATRQITPEMRESAPVRDI